MASAISHSASAFSAFNYSYAPFQLVGGCIADLFGARRTLTVCGLAWSITTMATGAVGGLVSLFAVRLVLGMGKGATLPAATGAVSNWTSTASRGSAVGITHAAGRLGAGAAAPIVAFLITWFSWRVSFVVLGVLSAFWAALWWWYFHEDPRRHPGITAAELAALPAADPGRQVGSGPVPWRRLVPPHGADDVRLLLPGLDRLAMCDLDAVLVLEKLWSRFQEVVPVLRGYAVLLDDRRVLGGVTADYLLRRPRSLQIARSMMIAVSWTLAVAALVPAIFVHDLVVGITSFALALFFLGFVISPMWTATMDIAPAYAGSASALMNAAGAVAGLLSPQCSAGSSTGWAAGRRPSLSLSGCCCSGPS